MSTSAQTFRDRHVLGERPLAGAEHLIARLEPGDTLTDRLDTSPPSPDPAPGPWAGAAPSTGRIAYGSPVITCQSPMNTLAARTRTKTSPLPAVGRSMSAARLTASAVPYSSWTIAFTQFLLASPREPLASLLSDGTDRELVMITAHGLRKRYGDKVAVDDLYL